MATPSAAAMAAAASAAAAEDWATKEKFILACCVSRSGDQNWVSVSRTMKLITEACGDGEKRPPEWFSQKNCATKYNQLLNTAFATKRKVRGQNSDSINIETPAEQILRKLTFKRIEELDQAIKTERERYKKLKSDIEKIQGGLIDDQLPAIWNAIQSGQNVPLETLIKQDEPEPTKSTASASSAQSTTSTSTPSRPQRATKETEKYKGYIEQRQKHNAKYHHHSSSTSTSAANSPATPVTAEMPATSSVGPSPAQVQNVVSTPNKGLLTTKQSVEQQQYLQQQQQQQQQQQLQKQQQEQEAQQKLLQQKKQQELLQQQQQQKKLEQQKKQEQLLQQQQQEQQRLQELEQERQLQLKKQEEEKLLAQQKQKEEEERLLAIKKQKEAEEEEKRRIKEQKEKEKKEEEERERKLIEEQEQKKKELLQKQQQLELEYKQQLELHQKQKQEKLQKKKQKKEKEKEKGKAAAAASAADAPEVPEKKPKLDAKESKEKKESSASESSKDVESKAEKKEGGGSFLTSLLSTPATEIKAQVDQITEVLKEPIKNPHHITKESYEAYKKAQPPSPSTQAPVLSKLLETNVSPTGKGTSSVSPIKLRVSPGTLENIDKTHIPVFSPDDENTKRVNLPIYQHSPSDLESPLDIKRSPKKSPVTGEGLSVPGLLKTTDQKASTEETPKKSSTEEESAGSGTEKPTESETKSDTEKANTEKLQTSLTVDVGSDVDVEKVSQDEGTGGNRHGTLLEVAQPPVRLDAGDATSSSASTGATTEGAEITDSSLVMSPKVKKKKGGRKKKKEKPTPQAKMKIDLLSELEQLNAQEFGDDEERKKTPLTPSLHSPASPALSTGSNCDPETAHQQRAWRKSIMLVWKAAASHKYANIFLHPVTDEEAPGYSSIIYRPMDLSLIKKNIETGVITTTSEFQRDIMLMFQNALMYNRKEHDVYQMAQEMRDDVMEQIQSYISAQMMVQTADRDSKSLRGKIEAPGHTRNSSKSGFSFLAL